MKKAPMVEQTLALPTPEPVPPKEAAPQPIRLQTVGELRGELAVVAEQLASTGQRGLQGLLVSARQCIEMLVARSDKQATVIQQLTSDKPKKGKKRRSAA
jgi:hypothetical protein